jgi:flagellar biogenesis protein FliO
VFPFSFKHLSALRREAARPQSLGDFFQRCMPVLGRRGNLAGVVEHLGTMPLTAQSSLALVKLRDEMLLLGITPQNITLLAKGDVLARHESTADRAPAQKGSVES